MNFNWRFTLMPLNKLVSLLQPRRTPWSSRKVQGIFRIASRWDNKLFLFLINHSMDITLSHRVPHAAPSFVQPSPGHIPLTFSLVETCWFFFFFLPPLRMSNPKNFNHGTTKRKKRKNAENVKYTKMKSQPMNATEDFLPFIRRDEDWFSSF